MLYLALLEILLKYVAKYLLRTEDHRSMIQNCKWMDDCWENFMVSLKESCFSQFPKLKDFLDGNCF